MPGVRVYQLAKELKVQSALILELLDRMGRDVKSDLSNIDVETAELVRRRLTAAIEAEKKRLLEERHQEEQRLVEGTRPKTVETEERAAAEEAPEPAAVEEPAAEPGAPAPPAPEPGTEIPLAAAPVVAEDLAPAEPVAPSPSEAEPPVAAVPPIPEAPRPRVFAAKRIPSLSAIRAASAAGRAASAAGRAAAARTAPPLRTEAARPAPAPRPPVAGRPPLPGRPAPAPPGPSGPTGRRKKTDEAIPPPVARQKPDLPPVPEKINLSEAVTVKELAEKLNRKSKDIIAKLMTRGVLANINQPLDPAVAIEVAKEFGSEASIVSFEEEVQHPVAAAVGDKEAAAETPGKLVPRPPVVTVMGHVDHGKTSLLDAIRVTNVVSTEHGGITQHIGAYQVTERDRKITFLDTPGHEAFTMMRARGARVTDIVVLVVAADDGVKPQTLEAIDHARAAGVPIVVAINKIDKPDARTDRVKQQLADYNLLVEEYGGQTVACEVSAKKRLGLAELLEMILLVTDIQDLKADDEKLATGVVLEARLDRARGIVATLLVQQGTLRIGDPFIAGSAFGKVRAMTDENGRRVNEAGPSTPVEAMGFASEPTAGDLFQSVADEWKARQIAQFRQEKARVAALAKSSRRTLESLSREIAEGEAKDMPILLKADVQGSLEALQKSLGDIPSGKVRVSVLRASTGAITQADVLLAAASNAIIVGFNVRPDRATAELARQEEVEIRLYTVIYEVVNDVRQAMVGMLEPTLKEIVLGQAEVRQLFRISKVGTVAGCLLTDGKGARTADVRLIRDNVVIYTGKLSSLKRFKDDVSEVKQGFECGIGVANFNDLKEGDVIEFFTVEKVAAQTL
jgi:translation initiation factor IF-2